VGHADHDFLHAVLARALHHFVHRDDEAFVALELETLLADVLGVQIAFETLGSRQALKDFLLLLGREIRGRADR
ncbi:hypothetical protein, partial [Klebsiella pneumoniae]|uniref:hypothetical protein n=1 Tax=Klebsiella pneumoniae TaxID=573 RepID=UPI00256F38BA